MKWCVLLEIETADPRVDPAMLATVSGTHALRQAVIAALPHDVTRVICVMPIHLAHVLMEAHDQVASAIGEPSRRPPRGYKAPGKRRGVPDDG